MAILELSIPPHFFDSADNENCFESVSERIAKTFLKDILKKDNITRGNPDLKEPDYIVDDHGYEVTFAISQSLILQLKGIRDLDSVPTNIEKELIAAITKAVDNKASKKYSCTPNLVVLTINTLPTWYSDLFFKETDPLCKMAWKAFAAKRNKLFLELYQNYIITDKFENIYIIQPTFNNTFAFYSIVDFINNKETFLTHVQSSNTIAFPTYRVIDAENLSDINSFKIKIVNYTIEDETEMKKNAAINFVLQNARPLELAIYKYFFENESNQAVVDELLKYQNSDGGFGNALEPDFFNPNSSPIATNDAIITLCRVNALDKYSDIVKGIVRYLKSHDSFDEDKKRWLFAIDSNKDYPHAIWWEKKGDGISGFNPSISLSAFLICYGNRTSIYEKIIKEGFEYLETAEEISGDSLKCFLLTYELLKSNGIKDIIDLEHFRDLLCKAVDNSICKDISKYGVEYVPMPSDFFSGTYLEFITPETKMLIAAEKEILGKLQMKDGGFDITWKWYTPYTEFEQARAWWRPRITIEKLLFNEVQI